MKIKILHMADTHLNRSAIRDEVTLGAMREAFAYALSNGVDLIVHAGDLTDKVIVNTAGAPLEALIQLMLAYSPSPKLIIRGTPTHDVDGALDFLKPIYGIQIVDSWMIATLYYDTFNNVYIWTRYDDENYREQQKVAAIFYCLPEPSKANLAASGVEAQLLDANFYEAVRKSLQAFRALDEYPDDVPRILVAHIKVSGAQSATGFSPQSPLTAQDLLNLSGADAVMLGDIHKAQSFCDGKVAYCGSPVPLDFGETEPNKGCLLWTFEGRELQSVETIPLQGRRLRTLQIHRVLDELIINIDDNEAAPLHDFKPRNFEKCEIKIRAPGELRDDPEAMKLVEKLEARLMQEADRVLPIEWQVKKQEARLRSETITQAKTLKDEVEEYARVTGQPLPDGTLDKAEGLEHATAASGAGDRRDD